MKRATFVIAALIGVALVGAAPSPAMAQRHCPPGLAKKNPPCIPPGQARRMLSDDDWRHRYQPGTYINRDDFIYLDDYEDSRIYRLPPLDEDEVYVVADGGIMVLSRSSLRILRLIELLSN